MLIIEVVFFAYTWWLGLFLVKRGEMTPAMRWVGAGLIVYALALALDILWQVAPDSLAPVLRWQVPLLFAPLLLWLVALGSIRPNLHQSSSSKRNTIIVFSIAMALGVGLLLVPLDILPRRWLIIAIGGDLLVLGYMVGVLDAFEQGERFFPDFLRAMIEAEVIALFFGGQVVLVMWLATGVTFPLMILLLFVVSSALTLQTFAGTVQAWFDQLIFARWPTLQSERATLRTLTDHLPRATQNSQPEWDEAEFAKLTRRALSHLGNLPKLATSPLIHLPLVDAQLQHEDNTLARASALKSILTNSIAKLRPDGATFGTTDAWRFYNAIYYPYVCGLKPYRRRVESEGLSLDEKRALRWFQTEVPQRTLYNWQTTAAQLIAQDLREQLPK